METEKQLILFDGTSITRRMKGVGRYAWNLVVQIDHFLSDDYTITVLYFEDEPVEFPPSFRGTLRPVRRKSELRFGIFDLKKLVSELKPAFLVRPSDATGLDYQVPTVTVCHDLNKLIWAVQEPRPLRRRAIDFVKEYFRGHGMRKSELVICNSRFVMDAVSMHFGLNRARVTIAPCGIENRLIEIADRIDRDHVRRRFAGPVGAEQYLFTFATGDAREGYEILPEFWGAAVSAGYPGALIIAGVNEEAAYSHILKQKFAKLPGAERVVWLPFLDNSRISDLAGLYSAADFYLEFSKHEGFGMQLAEAMACGTACFSTGCGALAEVGGSLALKLCGDPVVDGTSVAQAWLQGLHTGKRKIVEAHARSFTWDIAGRTVAEFIQMRAQKLGAAVVVTDTQAVPANAVSRERPNANALCLFIEPAPYIVQLEHELRHQWPASIHSLYIASSVSQKWEEADRLKSQLLPSSKLAATYRLWCDLRKHRPRIVFVAGWSHTIILAAIFMGWLSGARIVAFSDTWISESRGLRNWTKKAVLRRIDRFAPAGIRQADHLQGLGVPLERIFRANMTVDTCAMRCFFSERGTNDRSEIRDRRGVTENCSVFLFVGRLERIKGIDLLLEAFLSLSRCFDTRLVIVGDGSLRPMVEAAVAQDDRITYCGRLEGHALWAEYAASDVLVAPSRKEPWGLVVNEALAAGLAIVVSDAFGCIDDLVRHGENGIVVPADNGSAVVAAITRIARDRGLLERLRRSEGQRFEGWTTQAWARNITDIWQGLV